MEKNKAIAVVKSYQDLIVWQKGIALVKEIYLITGKFPNSEVFGLTSQMRRAAISVPSNVAEGQARNQTKDFIRFLYISRGSSAELETQLIIANQIGWINHEETSSIQASIYELQRMLSGLINRLSTRGCAQ